MPRKGVLFRAHPYVFIFEKKVSQVLHESGIHLPGDRVWKLVIFL